MNSNQTERYFSLNKVYGDLYSDIVCGFTIFSFSVFAPGDLRTAARTEGMKTRKQFSVSFSETGYGLLRPIEEFTLIVASWVIRARWRKIQRFVKKFKTS